MVYAPAVVTIFLDADIPRNRIGASLGIELFIDSKFGIYKVDLAKIEEMSGLTNRLGKIQDEMILRKLNYDVIGSMTS